MILPRQAPVVAPVTEENSSVTVDGVKSCVSGNFSQCTLGIIAVVLVGVSVVILSIWYFFHRRSKKKKEATDRQAAIKANGQKALEDSVKEEEEKDKTTFAHVAKANKDMLELMAKMKEKKGPGR